MVSYWEEKRYEITRPAHLADIWYSGHVEVAEICIGEECPRSRKGTGCPVLPVRHDGRFSV